MNVKRSKVGSCKNFDRVTFNWTFEQTCCTVPVEQPALGSVNTKEESNEVGSLHLSKNLAVNMFVSTSMSAYFGVVCRTGDNLHNSSAIPPVLFLLIC